MVEPERELRAGKIVTGVVRLPQPQLSLRQQPLSRLPLQEPANAANVASQGQVTHDVDSPFIVIHI
jgi:hypothetical protein